MSPGHRRSRKSTQKIRFEVPKLIKVQKQIQHLLNAPHIRKILSSENCPQIRPFGEQKPEMAQKNNENIELRRLPFDEYRDLDEDGVEPAPLDVYDWSEQGRLQYIRELLETNARNMVRLHLLQVEKKSSQPVISKG